jgi:hypothetical protein
MPKNEKPTFTTRKHLARLERERIQRRYLLIASAVVAFLVVALISFGLLDNLVLKFNAPVAQVGDKIVSVHDYQVEAKFQRLNLIQQFQQYYQFLQQFQGDPFGLTPQLQQISTQLTQPTLLGKDVVDRMVGDLVIEREALKRGITVTDAEVDAFVQRYYSYFPDGTPTPTLTPTLSHFHLIGRPVKSDHSDAFYHPRPQPHPHNYFNTDHYVNVHQYRHSGRRYSHRGCAYRLHDASPGYGYPFRPQRNAYNHRNTHHYSNAYAVYRGAL